MNGKRPASYQDIVDAPAHQVAELIDGELFLSPRPGGAHAVVASLLGGELIPKFWHGDGGPGGWLIIHEPQVHLGKHVVVPDLAGWRTSRMSAAPEGHKFTIVPDWVCEIASPSTERFDRKRKLPLYARAGVGHAWIIEPRTRAVTVYRRHDKHWLDVGYYFEDERVRAEPFDAVELDLSRLWRNLAQPTRASEDVGFVEYPY